MTSRNKNSILFLCSNEELKKLNDEDYNITINEANVNNAMNRQNDEDYIIARSFSKPNLPKRFLSKWYFQGNFLDSIYYKSNSKQHFLQIHIFADFEEMETFLRDINDQYDFVDLKIIGYSYEDRPIYVIEIDHDTVVS